MRLRHHRRICGVTVSQSTFQHDLIGRDFFWSPGVISLHLVERLDKAQQCGRIRRPQHVRVCLFCSDPWWTPRCSSFLITASVNTCRPWTGCESALTVLMLRLERMFTPACRYVTFRPLVSLRDLEGNQIQTLNHSILKTCSKLEAL